MGWVRVSRQVLLVGLLLGRWGLKYLWHCLMPPTVYISRHLDGNGDGTWTKTLHCGKHQTPMCSCVLVFKLSLQFEAWGDMGELHLPAIMHKGMRKFYVESLSYFGMPIFSLSKKSQLAQSPFQTLYLLVGRYASSFMDFKITHYSPAWCIQTFFRRFYFPLILD